MAAQYHASLLPTGERQAKVIEPMIERDTSDAHAQLHRIGEIRQRLLTRRMFLTEDHLPLRAVQRLPVADPPLQRASQIVREARMPSLHLQQQGDRAQSGRGPQQRYDLAVPILNQGIGATPAAWRALLGGSRGSVSSRAPVLVLKPALAAAALRVWVLRWFMYNFAC